MSLKSFHIIFIAMATVLSVSFGVWALRQYANVPSAGLLAMMVGSMVFAAVLVVYGVWFLRKLKNVSFL